MHGSTYRGDGAQAVRVVRENPFRLAIDIHGIGFKTADAIATSLGIAPTAPQRIEAGTLHLLGEAADRGHVHLPRAELLEAATRLLDAEGWRVDQALTALGEAGQVVVEPLPAAPGDAAEAAISLKPLHAAETGIAIRLRALLVQPPLPMEIDVDRALDWFEKQERLSLAGEQRQAIRSGLTRKVLVITGGPGTGKTTLVRGIVRILEKKGQKVLLAAPTGRAAKRLSEATGGEATTLHRLLEFNAQTRGFDRNRERPLTADLLIDLPPEPAYKVSPAVLVLDAEGRLWVATQAAPGAAEPELLACSSAGGGKFGREVGSVMCPP